MANEQVDATGQSDKNPALPIAWSDVTGTDAAREALKPINAFALTLRKTGNDGMESVDPYYVGGILLALVDRAEVILGIPDGSF